MHITVCFSDSHTDAWVAGLRAALASDGDGHAPNGAETGTTVSAWQPGDPPADYAVVWAPPQDFIDAQPRLRGLFNTGAGVDALMRLRLPAGVPVVRLDDSGLGVQMAEFVAHAVVRHFRELDAYQADTAAGRWTYREPRRRSDFPVGILGLGVLGGRVARALQALEFDVRGWSRTPKALDGVQCFAGDAQLGEFLAGTRILVCLLPLTPQTEDILDRATLSQLRPGGYLVNVARGRHLVDADLIALLDEGHLAGAALDVFRTEPLPADHPFWRHPKIALTPHTSARTLREESIAQIVGKVRAMERGEAVAGVVAPDRGY